MAWSRRQCRRYYYRSVRNGHKVTKVYCGCGQAGERAAKEDAERRAARAAARQSWAELRREIERIEALSRQLSVVCSIFADAFMVLAGFHRPFRAPWKLRNDAKQRRARQSAAERTR